MAKFGVPTEEQLAKINRLSPKTLSMDEVFVFGGKSAGDRIIENRYIQLHKELLETFLKDACTGVSWLLNHSWASYSEPVTIYGRTFDSRLETSTEEGETVQLMIDKYIPKSDTLKNGRTANSIIEDIGNGLLFDTSIGWGSNKMVCSICNMDYYGGDCSHYRGRTYEDADGNQKLCYVIAKNPGYLMEESGVFDGAYKGAGISMAKSGDVIETPQGNFLVVDELKDLAKGTDVFGLYTSKGVLTTFVKKSDNNKVFAVTDTLNTGQKAGNAIRTILKGGEKDMFKELLEKMKGLGIAIEDGKEYDATEIFSMLSENIQNNTEERIKLAKESSFMTQEQATEKLGKEMTADEVLKLAKEGQEYHKQVIDDAVAMGVRAQGNDFTVDTWKNTFSTMGTSAIKDIMKTFEAQANAEIPAGRLTNPGAGFSKDASIPDEAFTVGK